MANGHGDGDGDVNGGHGDDQDDVDKPWKYEETRVGKDRRWQASCDRLVKCGLVMVMLTICDDYGDVYTVDDGDVDDGDIYIMMKCLSVCLSRKMITSSWESPVTTCNHP